MKTPPLSVAVLVSAGINPTSGSPRAARGDAVALSLARRLGSITVRTLHAGSALEPALADYLALGAEEIEVVPVADGASIESSLVSRLQGTDLVVTGCRAEQGAGSGLLPYALARHLGYPVVANVLEVRVVGGEAHLLQFLPRGRRRKLAVRLPAVIAVHPMAPVTLAYAHAARASGRIVAHSIPLSVARQQGEDAEVRSGGGASPDRRAGAPRPVTPAGDWKPDPRARQVVRLKAEDRKPAHARLEAAIVSEKKGGLVVTEGSAADKAGVILDYLARHGLYEP